MSDNIPFDIQAEIIKNLPVKSLIRFRLVSKQWKFLIHSSKFIIAEYNTHQKRIHHLFVSSKSFNYSDKKYYKKYVSIVDDDTFPQHKFSLTVPTSLNLLDRLVLASSQGLLFVHGYDICSGTAKALIWNPAIKKSVDIDVCCALKPDYLTIFGFGVCSNTCDPKIVKFTCNTYWNKRDPVFDVFTLSTNAWRRLSKNLPRECIFITPYQVAIDRFMYWIAYEKIYADNGRYDQWNIQNLIVSFDMTSEEFTEISLPASLAAGEQSFNLYNIRESLVVVQFKIEAGKRVHSVWKMMEHGVSKSFTKLYTINTRDVIKHVHAFRKSGELIVETKNIDGRKDLFAYEPDSKQINYIGISGNKNFSAISYIETLLLLDH